MVLEHTRVTFRSLTAQVNIYIQMSSEMWEFDKFGDIYFEKTVDDYLSDLFNLWKEKNANHDVTITLFSRTFYDADDIEAFPPSLRHCIQRDDLGRFYEDFYRVVVQNERSDDWCRSKTIRNLKTIFNQYDNYVLRYHDCRGVEPPTHDLINTCQSDLPSKWHPSAALGIKPEYSTAVMADQKFPKAWNSSAAQGNILEVMNLALNVFDKYYIDRTFDRTGKQYIVITPGSGVFDVDRQLTNITRQRTIDCGNGSDLVCLGEQPLHAVPLFKFHKSANSRLEVTEDYNIPHWINHSFYKSKRESTTGLFLPRFFIPSLNAGHQNDPDDVTVDSGTVDPMVSSPLSEDAAFVDYDAYDNQVFKQSSLHVEMKSSSTQDVNKLHIPRVNFTTDHRQSLFGNKKCTSAIDIPSSTIFLPHSFGGTHNDNIIGDRLVGSVGTPSDHQRHRPTTSKPRRHRALINPFSPAKLHFKVTSNRRRWAHAFPTVFGASIQLHHQPSGVLPEFEPEISSTSPARTSFHSAQLAIEHRRQQRARLSECSDSSGTKVAKFQVGSYTNASSADSLPHYRSGDHSSGKTGGFSKVNSSSTLNLTRAESSSSIDSVVKVCVGSMTSSKGHLLFQHNRSKHASLIKELAYSIQDVVEGHHNWAWGITGEQEWTADTKTGTDWKSMAMPASLPLTTDFVPDETSLNNDYVRSDYALIPEDAHLGLDLRKPLTTVQVYNEMVFERIAQGFQAIIPQRSSKQQMPFSNLIRKSGGGKMDVEVVDEVLLSIGRIFHKLSVAEPSIKVTRYWPRHPYPLKSFPYRYRFRVPDSEIYDSSSTTFVSEKLENYNWNYLDLYLCSRGEDDFILQDFLKYWRARFFLLPSNNPATKKIIDGSDRCDIYEERSVTDQILIAENFTRFLEIANKLKRPTVTKMKPKSELARRGSISVARVELSTGIDGFTGGKAKNGTKGGDVSDLPVVGTPNVRSFPTLKERLLNINSASSDIVDALLDASEGLNFLKNQQGLPVLPSNCFISGEAVNWAQMYIDDVKTIKDGTELMQRIFDEGYIRYPSGNNNIGFIYGFYLYCLVPQGTSLDYCNMLFEREWCEVGITMNLSETRPVSAIMFDDEIPSNEVYDTMSGFPNAARIDQRHRNVQSAYKVVTVDVDPLMKSDRDEWGTALYHRCYNPNAAFDLTVHWLVATGCILWDLVSSWTRKANAYGFNFLPVPRDPFALPYMTNSDPLRAPIFIPLSVSCLNRTDYQLFSNYPKDTHDKRLKLLMESIASIFGFVPEQCKILCKDDQPLKFVHLTGAMFVTILTPTRCSDDIQVYQDYVSRHCGTPSGECVGFLWAWNWLLNKRWRVATTIDEFFQDKVLSDFRQFCSNSNGRLVKYWQQCRPSSPLPHNLIDIER